MTRKAGSSVKDRVPFLMGQRLQEERERLHMSLAEFAQLVGVTEELAKAWEASTGTQAPSMLTMFGRAGADVLYIVTGTRRDYRADGVDPEGAFKAELAKLPGVERRRLLLYLCTDELRSIVTR